MNSLTHFPEGIFLFLKMWLQSSQPFELVRKSHGIMMVPQIPIPDGVMRLCSIGGKWIFKSKHYCIENYLNNYFSNNIYHQKWYFHSSEWTMKLFWLYHHSASLSSCCTREHHKKMICSQSCWDSNYYQFINPMENISMTSIDLSTPSPMVITLTLQVRDRVVYTSSLKVLQVVLFLI